MSFFRNLLFISLVVVWISVIIKYESLAFLSRSSSGGGRESSSSNNDASSSGSRLREAIREKIHRAGNSNPQPAGNDHRIRQALSDKYHRVADKIHPSKPNPTPKQPIPNQSPKPQLQPQPPPPSPSSPSNYQPNIPAQPGFKQPGYQQPGFQQPGYQQPGFQQPGYQQPGYKPVSNDYPPFQPVPDPYPKKSSGAASIMKNLAKKILHSKGGHKAKTGSNYHNYQNGLYNDYNYRPDRYQEIIGSTCTNFLEYDGIVYGTFICPVEGFDLEATDCCGPAREQYCCRPSAAGSKYFGENEPYKKERNNGLFYMFIVVPFFILLILLGVGIFFCYKKRTYILEKLGKNDEGETKDENKDNEASSIEEKEALNNNNQSEEVK